MNSKFRDGSVYARLESFLVPILIDYAANISIPKIGKKYGFNAGYVWKLINESGVPMKVHKVPQETKRAILELHLQGMTAYAIAKKLQSNSTVVCKAIKDARFDISHRQWKREDPLINHKEEIIAKYESGLGGEKIAEDYGTSGGNILRLLRRAGVEIRTLRDYAHPVNEHFFDAIDTEEKAYVLGFMMADGSNCTEEGKVRLGIIDRDILAEMAEAMSYEGPLYEKPPRKETHQTQWLLRIGSRVMSDALVRVGCIYNKTYRATFPSTDIVPKVLVPHLIRGWHDGDGTLTARSETGNWHMRIVGTEAVCRELSRVCYEYISVPGTLCPVAPSEAIPGYVTWGFTISKREDLLKFLDWIYNPSTIRLDRKFQKYVECEAFIPRCVLRRDAQEKARLEGTCHPETLKRHARKQKKLEAAGCMAL